MDLRHLVVVVALALAVVGADAAAPPTPAPVSVLAGQVSVPATSSSSRVALPASTVTAYAITLRNTGTKDIHFRQGSDTVVALTTDPVIVGGDSVTIWVSGTYVAAITSGSDTGTLLVYQANGPLALRSTSTAGGGGGSGTVTEIDTGTGLTGGPITTSGPISLKPAAAGEIGGVNSSAAVSHNFLTAISTAGVISKAQPSCADISDASTGCSTAAYAIPVAQAATLGGVFSKAAITHNFLTSISSSTGAIGQAQPACADISDAGTGCSGAASAVGANPTQCATGLVHNGVATTFMRSDAAPCIGVITQQIVVNLNTANAPAPITGTVVQVVGADAANGFVENDTFGATPIFTGRRADGTGASPTAVQSAEALAGFSARPYDGTGYTSASTGNVQAVASENFSGTNHGTDLVGNCTAITTTTTAECWRAKSSGFTIPTGSTYQINGTQIACAALSNAGVFCNGTSAANLTGNQLTLSGNVVGAFSTTGVDLKQSAATITDSTTGAGTLATTAANYFAAQTLATGTNVITVTNAYGMYFQDPVAGSHVTLTNKWAIGADSARIGGTTISTTGAIIGASSIAATTNIQLGASGTLFWGGRTNMNSPSDGVLTVWNNANTDFGRLQFGGVTSSFPSIKRSAASLAFRVADDSADAAITAAAATFSGAITLSASNAFITGKDTDPGTAPGAAFCKEYWVAGTNSGTGKKIAYCGTSPTPVTLVDNVGGGF